LFDGLAAAAAQACGAPVLNPLMAMGPQASSALRLGLSRGLSVGGDMCLQPFLTPMARVDMGMPVAFRNFTNFFAKSSCAAFAKSPAGSVSANAAPWCCRQRNRYAQ